MAKPMEAGTVDVNGAKLYYELRGTGPSLLFIPGAEGDAEEYLRVVELLEDEFTILSYDRRGYSRCPRPEGYCGTTVEEQADDAAGLLSALDLAPAGVWGNSSGAIIGLGLVLRHPELVRKAMLHEPPLYAGMGDWQQVLAFLKEATAQGKVPFLTDVDGRRGLRRLLRRLPGASAGRRHVDPLRVRQLRVVQAVGRGAGQSGATGRRAVRSRQPSFLRRDGELACRPPKDGRRQDPRWARRALRVSGRGRQGHQGIHGRQLLRPIDDLRQRPSSLAVIRESSHGP